MALPTFTANTVLPAADLTNIIEHLQGASGKTDAYHFRCSSGNNYLITLSDAAGARKVSVRDSALVEVMSINSDGAMTLASTLTISGGGFAVTGDSSVTGTLTATTLAGPLSTAAQPAVTSLGTLAANLLFVDATHDIGVAGATRPRDIFASRNITTGGGQYFGDGQTILLSRGADNRLDLATGDSLRVVQGTIQLGSLAFSTPGNHNIVLEEGTPPSGTATNAGAIYVVDAAGTTELRYVDSAGGVTNVS